jgi:hypothetical protein
MVAYDLGKRKATILVDRPPCHRFPCSLYLYNPGNDALDFMNPEKSSFFFRAVVRLPPAFFERTPLQLR